MDDLLGLSFDSSSSNSKPSSQNPPQPQSRNPFSAPQSTSSPAFNGLLRPTPSPSNGQQSSLPFRGPSPSNAATKPAPKSDSFANLVSFNANKNNTTSNLSLQEQQRRLHEQRLKEAEEKRRQMTAAFGGLDALDRNSAFAQTRSPPARQNDPEEDDLFAAFAASAPVDKSSHYPPPSEQSSTLGTPNFGTPAFGTPNFAAQRQAQLPQQQSGGMDLFDDPFDLGKLPSRGVTPAQPAASSGNDDEFDILGDLARPASDFVKPAPTPSPKPPTPSVQEQAPPRKDPRDAAIAELMDMGFSLPQCKKALAETDSGLDVQQAVSWLLNEAHRQAKGGSSSSTPAPRRDDSRGPADDGRRRRADPDENYRSDSRRRDASQTGQPAWSTGGASGGDKDLAATAQQVAGTLFKSANSLWSQARKKAEKAVQEFQQDKEADSGVPKWMREAQQHQQQPERRISPAVSGRGTRETSRGPEARPEPDNLLTDEALMLEAGSGPPPKPSRGERRVQPEPPSRRHADTPPMGTNRQPTPQEIQRQREREFAEAVRRKEMEMREREAANASSRKAKLTREAVEQETAYISPARRRKAADTPPAQTKPNVPEGDLFSPAPPQPSRNPFLQQQQSQPPQQQRKSPAPPIQPRAPVPVRASIPISPASLQQSSKARLAGSEAFKLGDYSKALTHYTSSLTPVPDQHPLRILLLCNRAIANLKLGDAKACLTDCNDALTIIGPGQGRNEAIQVDNGETKEMREFWGKAMTRKAEALEQLEKWSEAGATWTELAEGGMGGATSGAAIAGKRRCEKALAPKAAPKPVAAKPAPARRPPPPKQSTSSAPAEAVNRLREATANSDAVEAEKLALYDTVQNRITTWKGGKEGNLRALLTSLDAILWPEAGWKKVGMHELVIPGKVKGVYMRGIAKVHPDKISTTATTEQRMISGAVFSLLNEAWDKFKVDNNL